MKVNIIDNDLLSIQEARILAENAYEAQQKLATFPQEKLDEIVEAMAQAASSHAKELAVMSAEERIMANGRTSSSRTDSPANICRLIFGACGVLALFARTRKDRSWM